MLDLASRWAGPIEFDPRKHDAIDNVLRHKTRAVEHSYSWKSMTILRNMLSRRATSDERHVSDLDFRLQVKQARAALKEI